MTRSFGDREALRGVSMRVRAGEVHALLGPNGAGKTTLLRILTGLADPTGGTVLVLGQEIARGAQRRTPNGRVGLVPSGDRTFYERIGGLENLAFFGRLHGLRRRAAVARAGELLELVGLGAAARTPVGRYSHGMQKRLSFARALLTDPALLLVDEATHDLDPEGAERVRAMTSALAAAGTAVVWATQRVDEIRGFADAVTFLDRGEVRFAGSVAELIARGGAAEKRFVLQIRNGRPQAPGRAAVQRALGDSASLVEASELGPEHVLLAPRAGAPLSAAIVALAQAGYDVVACRQERSEVEEAFLALTAADAP